MNKSSHHVCIMHLQIWTSNITSSREKGGISCLAQVLGNGLKITPRCNWSLWTCGTCTELSTYIYIYIFIVIHIYICKPCIHIYTHVCMYVCMYVCIFIYSYTNTYNDISMASGTSTASFMAARFEATP